MSKKTTPRQHRSKRRDVPGVGAPNKATIAAIKEARRGGLKRYPSTKALLKSLNTDD